MATPTSFLGGFGFVDEFHRPPIIANNGRAYPKTAAEWAISPYSAVGAPSSALMLQESALDLVDTIGARDLDSSVGTVVFRQPGPSGRFVIEVDATGSGFLDTTTSEYDITTGAFWWFAQYYHDATLTATRAVLQKRQSGDFAGYAIYLESNGDWQFRFDDGVGGHTLEVPVASVPYLPGWYDVAITRDALGVCQGFVAPTGAASSSASPTNTLATSLTNSGSLHLLHGPGVTSGHPGSRMTVAYFRDGGSLSQADFDTIRGA